MPFVRSLLRRRKSPDFSPKSNLNDIVLPSKESSSSKFFLNRFTRSLRRSKNNACANGSVHTGSGGDHSGTFPNGSYSPKEIMNPSKNGIVNSSGRNLVTSRLIYADKSEDVGPTVQELNRLKASTSSTSVDAPPAQARESASYEPPPPALTIFNHVAPYSTTRVRPTHEPSPITFEQLEQELLSLADDLQPRVARSTPRNAIPVPRCVGDTSATTSRDGSVEPETNRDGSTYEFMLENSLMAVQLLQNNLNSILDEVSHKSDN